MHQPGVRGGQRIGHLAADVEDEVEGQWTVSGEIRQRPSGHVFIAMKLSGAVVLDFVAS